jgi:NitT/TauT family transport system permease protein
MSLAAQNKSHIHRAATVLFIALLAALAVPPKHGPTPFVLAGGVIVAEAVRLLRIHLHPDDKDRRVTAGDLAALTYGFFFAWHLTTAHAHLLDAVFFPPPEIILRLFFHELPAMATGAVGSLSKLMSGYVLALAVGIGLGVLFGSNRRLFNAAAPFAKALGPIPPIIYTPYAVCFLPGLVTAQVFVIFIGAFWPVFLSTLNGIQNIPRGQLDAARTLDLSGHTLRLKILLPGALPSICSGALLGLVFAFILLTAAELLGSSSGAGWYIKNFADFGDFERVIVGVIFVGVLVLAVTAITDRIERRLLQWHR